MHRFTSLLTKSIRINIQFFLSRIESGQCFFNVNIKSFACDVLPGEKVPVEKRIKDDDVPSPSITG